MTDALTMPRTPGIRGVTERIEAENQIVPRQHHGTHEDILGVQRAAGRHHPSGTTVGIRSKRNDELPSQYHRESF
jgi:hypothetical protein